MIAVDVLKRIERAEELYKKYRYKLLQDDEIRNLLDKLNYAIERTWEYMRKVGVTEICRQCAMETGSCCKRWVEDKYDEYLLLINLLLGVELPKERYKEDGCFFVGPNGCRLRAREVICVSFLCDKIINEIGKKEVELQTIAGNELETLFILKDRIKSKIEELRSSDYKSKLGRRIS